MSKRTEHDQEAKKSHKHRIRRRLLWRKIRHMFVLSHGKSPVTSVEGLDLVEAGQRVRIIQVELRQSIHYKLADMGITPGAEVLVQEKAPFGGPILIRIRGTMLALRPSEASCILVGPIGS